jgi:transcriptional regulator of arginine metabolism
MTTAGRRAQLHRFIEAGRVTSQSQAAKLLTDAGYPVTQATVSRDLHAIGAVKTRDEDGSHYEIAHEQAPELTPTVEQFVLDVIPTGNLVVVKTPPGAAHFVASALDGSGRPEIAGTVAGDDTVLVVTAPGSTAKKVAALLIGEPS